VATSGRRSLQLLGLVVLLEVGWIGTRGCWAGALGWGPLLAVLAAHAALVARIRRTDDLPGQAVVGAVVVVAAAAVLAHPYGSRDLYQYAFYGRMVAHHGADPYAVDPSAFAGDALFGSLAAGWHRARSVYGPVFTWFSTTGATVFGSSPLLARLWFQGAAGVALVASAIQLRREVGPAAAVGVGLSPVLVATVNGGHNDLLVGWLLLVAAGPALRRRPAGAGAVLGLAACVKLTALPVVLALALCGVHRRRWRSLGIAGTAFGFVVVGAYGVGGGLHLLAPLASVGDRTSRASGWALLERLGGGSTLGGAVLAGAAVVASAWVALVAWRWRSAPQACAATAAGAAACFAAPYVLPWYPAAFLPLSGRVPASRAAVVLQVGGAALLLAYVVPPGRPPGAVPLAAAAAAGCGALLVALVVVLAGGPRAWSGYRRRRGQPGTGARRHRLLPRLSAAGGVARGGRAREAGGLSR
jgi:hypothetical protein